MKNILKYILLGLMLLSTQPLSAYNSSWSSKEDITDPCPGGENCEPPPPCHSRCGCTDDGKEIPCECPEGQCCNQPPAPPPGTTSSPVYTKTGMFTWQDTDISLIAKPSLGLIRSYKAFDPHLGLFGKSWISGFEKLFIETVKYSKDDNGVESSEIYYVLRLISGDRYFYRYDKDNQALIDTGKLKVKAQKIDEHTTTLTYKNGMVETYEDGYLISKEDSSGNTLTLTYDDKKLLQRVESGTASLSFAYNSNGFVSQVTDHTSRAWSYSYDENGNLIEVTNPTGGTKTYSYQAHKTAYDAQIDYLMTEVLDEEGIPVVSVAYKDNGKVDSYTEGTHTYSYEYLEGNKVVKTDNEGNTLSFITDKDGFIIQSVDELNTTTQKSYDKSSHTKTIQDKNGHDWVKKYDALGRLIASIDPLNNSTTYTYEGNNTKPKTIKTPLGHVTTMTYDSKGKPLTLKDAKGNTQSFKYDSKGNATEITDAKGNKTTITYNSNNQPVTITNALGYTTTIAYDTLGRQQSITDAEGRTTTYEYDAMDRIVKTTDAIGNVVVYSYDKAGRLTTLKDPVGNETTYTYDDYGRVATETRPDSGLTKYDYNSDNTIHTITRRDGKVVTYAYDAAKRPTSQSVDNDTISYTYDAEGNILTATNTSGTVSFTYDVTGKLKTETQLGITLTTLYDKDSNVKTLKFLDKIVSYGRDKLGLATSINTIDFIYDKNSIQTQVDYPNNTSEHHTFDAIYNIKKIETANQTIDYTQDKTGLIKSKSDVAYEYDAIGRLTKAGADSFSYDKAGNNQNKSATYNTLNNQMNENLLYKITYDSMGNIATKYNKLTKETSTYTFSARNQLTSYTKQDENNQTTKTLTYTYDAFNRRVSKTEDGITQKYLYDGDDIVAILDNANQVIATITHDESIDTPLSITNANGTFYYHRDHQGSIVALTDSTGAVVESFTYDNHYGTITNHTITTETNNPYAYTGRELDTDELYYYRARYYDATVQRFLSEDSIGFMSKDFNFYRYVSNAPINHIDPYGYEDCEVINKTTGWYETAFSRMKDPIAIYLGSIVVKIGGKAAFAGCRWRLVKDIEEERKTRTYIICEKCNTEQIVSDTGWVTENRIRKGAEYYKTTIGVGFNLTGGSGSYDNPKKFEYISCPNPVTGIWGWH